MRCRAWVKQLKTKVKPVLHPGPWRGIDGKPMFNEQPENTKVCGGKLVVTVKAIDEPDYCSDHYAVLVVEIRCERCGWIWHGEPPPVPTDGEGIGNLLTKMIAEIKLSKSRA